MCLKFVTKQEVYNIWERSPLALQLDCTVGETIQVCHREKSKCEAVTIQMYP